MKPVQEVAKTPIQQCLHRRLSPKSGEFGDQGPRSLTPNEVRMELVQELARTPIRQSEAGSTGQAGTKRAAAAVSMTCLQLHPQPVEMLSAREAFARDASRKVRLANGQCSDQMGRPGHPALAAVVRRPSRAVVPALLLHAVRTPEQRAAANIILPARETML